MEVSTACGPVLFGVFYRPPSQGATGVSALNNCLLSVSRLPVVLCGDFNLPNIDWSIVFPTVSSHPVTSEFCDLVRENCFTQLVSVPTRHHHLLDLLLTRAAPILVSVSVSGQYQHFLMVSESVMYVVQVPILLFVHYIYY